MQLIGAYFYPPTPSPIGAELRGALTPNHNRYNVQVQSILIVISKSVVHLEAQAEKRDRID